MARILSPGEIAQLAYSAGFRGADLIYAVAVALLESGGNPEAYNPETAAGTAPGAGSRGLWQIYGTAHPEYNNEGAFNPVVNAQAAYKVYREAGGKFTPWSTWNNGSAQRKAMELGNVAAGGVAAIAGGIGSIGAAIPTAAAGLGGSIATSGASAITEAANNIMDSLGAKLLGKNAEGKPRELADAMAYFGGFTLILLGLIFLFVKSGAAEKVINVAGVPTQ